MERRISMPVGIVVERRKLNNRWQKAGWRPVDVIPGAGQIATPKELLRGEGWVSYHLATLPLELHRKETLAYKTNLNDHPPRLYVVLRTGEGGLASDAVKAFLVTASPFEAQNYLDAGDDIVEGVAMPAALIAWVRAFCDRHHVDEPFKKRTRKRDEAADKACGGTPERQAAGDRQTALRGRDHGRA